MRIRPGRTAYLVMLDWSLRHRSVIVAIMVVTFISTVPLCMAVNKILCRRTTSHSFGATRAPEGST